MLGCNPKYLYDIERLFLTFCRVEYIVELKGIGFGYELCIA